MLVMIELPARILKKLLLDPVMAAEVLMGWRLDVFQAAALRMDWWFPETIDSSGVSTGKTLRTFILLNLRCILMENHVAAFYMPSWQTAKDEFWAYFDKTCKQSPIYVEQCLKSRNVVGELKEQGSWTWRFKNGSKIIMPAPSWVQDADTQAGRRVNTMVIDDWIKVISMGDGVDKQLLDRVTRPCFNQGHPIWQNHTHFKGHADRPGHKSHRRLLSFQRLIDRGSVGYALYTFCFRDYSPRMAKDLRPDQKIAERRQTLTRDQFGRQWLGVWTRDGATFYPEAVLHIACADYLKPVMRRQFKDEVNILGFDVAPGAGIRSDTSAAVNLRIVEWFKGFPLPVTYEHAGRAYNIAFTFASFLRNKSAPETAGFIHYLHRLFGFSSIVLDPGGGGLWVYKDLKNPEQIMDGRKFDATPLCTPQEPILSGKRAIVHFFKRGVRFDELAETEPAIIERQFLAGDDGFIQAFHHRFRECWELPEFHWPLPLAERNPREVEEWAPEIVDAHRFLDESLGQLCNVVQDCNEEGLPIISKRGFNLFRARGKKDGAYAAFMANAGKELFLHGGDYDAMQNEEDIVFACA